MSDSNWLGKRLEYYDGAGFWGTNRGTVIEVTDRSVVVDWDYRSGESSPMGRKTYSRADFARWVQDKTFEYI